VDGYASPDQPVTADRPLTVRPRLDGDAHGEEAWESLLSESADEISSDDNLELLAVERHRA
jgi:hypothetical protein